MTDNDLLNSLLTPEEIARRITASSGAHITARTVWEKAKRIGVAKKIGRSMLISIEDVPALLREEKPTRSPVYRADFTRDVSTKRALAMIRKKRRGQ